ncbi:DUF2541 family protein [Flavobacterium sp.]|uniref:DUF2541 family protein n=1 Tax=Flavobacterium sp. TaxID=239 RepID=UPI00286DD86F|nr:DUF2541 family protein [Flavobacterium sp.]
MKKRMILFGVLTLLFFNTNLLAQDKGWEKIGARKVDYRVEKDVLPVTAAKGTFTKLKFFVKNGAVNFKDIKVFYRNGTVQDIEIRKRIAAGGETRLIDLDGKERVITKIEFVYDTKNSADSKATVVVFAKE